MIGLFACAPLPTSQKIETVTPRPTYTPIKFREAPQRPDGPKAEPSLPERDLVSLARRLRNVDLIPAVVRTEPLHYHLGDVEHFWVSNTDTNGKTHISATLAYTTPHLYLWIEKGAQIDNNLLKSSADRFEEYTYPTNHRLFGWEWSPGVDSDEHLSVLHAKDLGYSTGGFYLSADEYSRLAHSYSNEREMFYVNLDTVIVGSDYYNGLLAHEFQHMIHWNKDRNEDLWLNEGLSVLAAQMNGYDTGSPHLDFLTRPDLQLNYFLYEGGEGSAHYGAAYLFMLYFMERLGESATKALVAHPANGITSIDMVLDQLKAGIDMNDLFADWTAALFLDAPELDDGRFGYQQIDLPRPSLANEHTRYPVPSTKESVHQYGIDYISLRGTAPLTVIFTGTRETQLVGTLPREGSSFFWSNRGDNIDTTLTGSFDLGDLNTATLHYWLWYDIEEGWDYAYVEISVDGGKTWDTLQTDHTTDLNPSGNNYGFGYSGESGNGSSPEWIQEQVNLTPYAGHEVMIRFEYITDGAIHGNGLIIDDLSIPELAFSDGFEEDGNTWHAAGFQRTDNKLSQQFMIQLVTPGPNAKVQRLFLDEREQGRWNIPLDEKTDQAILVISGTTPFTLEPALYEYQVTSP